MYRRAEDSLSHNRGTYLQAEKVRALQVYVFGAWDAGRQEVKEALKGFKTVPYSCRSQGNNMMTDVSLETQHKITVANRCY